MIDLSIALGDESEIPRYLEIRRAAFDNQAPSAYTREEVDALLERDESPGMQQMIELGQLFVAKVDDVVIGLVGWRDKNLYNLYVDPNYMRRGVGTKLLREVEAQFVERSGEATFHVDAGLYTRKFYESQGYIVTSTVTASDGLRYLEMQKHLQ